MGCAMNGVLVCAAVTCFASFGWGMERFFTKPGPMSSGERLIRLLGILFGGLHLWQLVSARLDGPGFGLAGVALYLLSLGLFWWSIQANAQRPLAWAFRDCQAEHLVRQGPYRWVRHPFYSSYVLAWLAGAVATQSLILLATALTMAAIYAKAAALEERRFLEGPLARSYEEYRQTTGRFCPKVWGSYS